MECSYNKNMTGLSCCRTKLICGRCSQTWEAKFTVLPSTDYYIWINGTIRRQNLREKKKKPQKKSLLAIRNDFYCQVEFTQNTQRDLNNHKVEV